MGLFDNGFKSKHPYNAGEYSDFNQYGRAPEGYGYLRVVDPSVPRGYRNVGLVLGKSRVIPSETPGSTYNAFGGNMGKVSTMPVAPTPTTTDLYKKNPIQTTTPGGGSAPTVGPRGETAGYVQPLQWNNPTNPYAGQQTADSAEGAKAQQYASQNIQQLQAQSQQAASNYPAMANDYGLGASPGSGSAPGYSSQPTTQTASDNSSRGFNPWSLVGEANARGN